MSKSQQGYAFQHYKIDSTKYIRGIFAHGDPKEKNNPKGWRYIRYGMELEDHWNPSFLERIFNEKPKDSLSLVNAADVKFHNAVLEELAKQLNEKFGQGTAQLVKRHDCASSDSTADALLVLKYKNPRGDSAASNFAHEFLKSKEIEGARASHQKSGSSPSIPDDTVGEGNFTKRVQVAPPSPSPNNRRGKS